MKWKKILLAGILCFGGMMTAQAELDGLAGFAPDTEWRYLCATDSQTTYLYQIVNREKAGTAADGSALYYTDIWVRNEAADGAYDLDKLRVYSDKRYAVAAVIEIDAKGKVADILEIAHPEERLQPVPEDTMPELLYHEAYETPGWRNYLKTH